MNTMKISLTLCLTKNYHLYVANFIHNPQSSAMGIGLILITRDFAKVFE